jgi:hypothetical protein
MAWLSHQLENYGGAWLNRQWGLVAHGGTEQARKHQWTFLEGHWSVLEYLDSRDGTWTGSVEEEYNPKAELLDTRVVGKDDQQNSRWTAVERE